MQESTSSSRRGIPTLLLAAGINRVTFAISTAAFAVAEATGLILLEWRLSSNLFMLLF
jgi:hypothetical protein